MPSSPWIVNSTGVIVVVGGLAVIYRDDLTVRQHPLRDKLPAVTSFELQLFRVGSTAPFLAVINRSDYLMLCGDVNCPSAIGLGHDKRLSTTLMELGLTQQVTQPTRGDRLLDIVASDYAIPVRNVLVSDNAGIFDHRLITAEVLLPLQIESSIRHITPRTFSKFDAMWCESTLLSSELYTSPETDVDQLERVVTSALDANCPAKTRRVRFSRRRWNAAGYALVVKVTKKTFVGVAVTLTDSSMSPDGS